MQVSNRRQRKSSSEKIQMIGKSLKRQIGTSLERQIGTSSKRREEVELIVRKSKRRREGKQVRLRRRMETEKTDSKELMRIEKI